MRINLTKKEIKLINDYINDTHDFYALECIYLLPRISDSGEKIKIVTVLKENFFCKGSILERPANMEEIWEKDKEFDRKCNAYRMSSENTRLFFSRDNELHYFHESFASVWLQELISGTIIYDQSSKFTQLRDDNLSAYKPYKNLLEIENLDQVNFISHKGTSLKKKI